MEDTIPDNPTSSIETAGRISKLPEDIIRRILFFLPAKDATCSSILSKTWLHALDSLPVFSFSSDALSQKPNLLKQDVFPDSETDEYMHLIEQSLEKLRHHKVRIKRFQLDLFESHERHASRFNQFMELANRNQVEELVLHGLVSDGKKPGLPRATFASTNSFRVVELKFCVLTPESLTHEPRFPCLTKLALFEVKLSGMDQMVENLLANCPLLEEFSLHFCELERVKLNDHPKLEKVSTKGVGVIWIKAENIKTLQLLYTGDKPLELHLVYCSNLEELWLCSNFTAEYIQDLVAKLPHLRHLKLAPCLRFQRLKISSPQLRHFVFWSSPGGCPNEVEIDAPNLKFYDFVCDDSTAEATVSQVFINTTSPTRTSLGVIKRLNLDTQCFIDLKNCLKSFQYNSLEIHVRCDMTNKDSILANLRQNSADQPVDVACLSVAIYPKSFDYEAFLDCCFWVCRPKTLFIASTWDSFLVFIELLRHKLIPWEQNLQCCGNSDRKCWRHYLQIVDVQKTERIALRLNWKMLGQKRKDMPN